MVKGVISVMLVLLLAGCSETVSPPTQKAQRARITPQTTLNMAQLKSAARSYYAANHAQYGAALQGSGGYPL